MNKPTLIDKRDVSQEYGIPVSTQEALTAKGDFCPHLRVGNKWYYRREPRPGVTVIGDRLLELADGAEGICG